MRELVVIALLGGVIGGCDPGGTGADAAIDGPPDASLECEDDTACDDAVYCNGAERCEAGRCVGAAAPDCDDGLACTRDRCVEDEARCAHVALDEDGDGHGAASCVDAGGAPLGDDCDDGDPGRFPGNIEACDADDDDCDPATRGDRDADSDGVESAVCCDPTTGCGADCDDARASVGPSGVEVCNLLDDDCDGRVDEDVALAGFADDDRDGHGDGSRPMMRCASTPGFSVDSRDCDDADPARHELQVEVCDEVDNDCDTRVDEEARAVAWYRDLDGDGFGSAASGTLEQCVPPTGHVLLGSDCDDGARGRSPGSPEQCNAIDDDCNGVADFVIAPGDLEDDDGDSLPDLRCGAPLGVDCQDRDPSAGPGIAETCNGLDDDCDERIDERAPEALWYPDTDGDGFGDASRPTSSCAPVAGHVARGGDCDDASAAVRPGASEGCDGVDEDCDRAIDESPASASCGGLPHVTSGACSAGACARLVCDAGFADCDADVANGCEADLGSDTSCGACGRACAGGAGVLTTRCDRALRACVIDTCVGGRGDCDGSAANGCETDTTSDLEHCGVCGRECVPTAGASVRCALGGCVLECASGLADCNADASDGCEVDLLRAPLHCGMCGRACVLPNATASCSLGMCRIASCAPGFADCNASPTDGCEARLDDDALHCGACGRSCSGGPGVVSSVCDTGACRVTCMLGWADCDGLASSGCETRVDTPTDCGACGARCSFAHAGASCDPGTRTCRMEACVAPWADCDGSAATGCERSFGVPSPGCSCGAPACNLPRAIAGCAAGSCIVAGCTGGYADCNGLAADGCEIPVSSDPMNCGMCGISCGAAGSCINGGCDRTTVLSLGARHSCAVRAGGGAACWGDGTTGAIGDGFAGYRLSPFPVVGGPMFVDIAAGDGFSCGLDAVGRVHCWGTGGFGQLGNGGTGGASTPSLVSGPVGVIDVAVARSHVCALASGGQVWCWGRDTVGQTGVATPRSVLVATLVSGGVPSDAAEIEAGESITCVIAPSSPNPVCWGALPAGSTPTPTALTTGVEASIRDLGLGGAHGCVLYFDGRLVCWGAGADGQLGDETSYAMPQPPRLASRLFGAGRGLALGAAHTCVLDGGGAVWCVGRNASGELGRGTVSPQSLAWASAELPPSDLVAASSTGSHTCALTSAGGMMCWGRNLEGQLGTGMTSSLEATPRTVSGL